MIAILRALTRLVFREPSRLAHGEIDHRHWSRETQSWRSHDEQQQDEEVAA